MASCSSPLHHTGHAVNSATALPDRIVRLFDHPDRLPELQHWFEQEWADYYGPEGPGDAAADLRAYCRADGLPLALIALRDERLCGIAALKTDSIAGYEHCQPWAGAALVAAELRRQGIGAELLRQLAAQARLQGFPKLYCATATAQSLLQRLGWTQLPNTVHHGVELAVFVTELDEIP
jgi:GNAT superfamily N-acetyltransferase